MIVEPLLPLFVAYPTPQWRWEVNLEETVNDSYQLNATEQRRYLSVVKQSLRLHLVFKKD